VRVRGEIVTEGVSLSEGGNIIEGIPLSEGEGGKTDRRRIAM
jgi:hypothetical protein